MKSEKGEIGCGSLENPCKRVWSVFCVRNGVDTNDLMMTVAVGGQHKLTVPQSYLFLLFSVAT